ncbi:MAG: hypothetical protein Q8O76_07425 [Chloroflexota bacterium]|nr:hypothetical protein [Chloroflexota bacterium]
MATQVGATTTSGGRFKTSKAMGSFAGLLAAGTYSMTIVWATPNVLGTAVTVAISAGAP